MDRLERRPSSRSSAAAEATIVRSHYRTAAGNEIAHEQRATRAGGRRHPRRRRASTIPAELGDLARIGTDVRDRARARAVRVVRDRPARDVSGPEARRDRRPLDARPSPTSTCPYIRPQENGGHADVRWFTLTDGAGRGLRIDLETTGQVSATHLRAADLAEATHDVDLRRAPETSSHLDAAHRGLGPPAAGRTRCPST